MTGVATTYFQGKLDKYQTAAQVEQQQAQALSARVVAAKAALAILAKPSISQSEAESLVQLYLEAQ